MSRALRVQDPGSIYHVTAHGLDSRPIFRDDLDRQDFVVRLGRVVSTFAWRLYGVCLLETHLNLLVCVSAPNLGRGMQVVNGGHARAFNLRHRRRGALFESRYRDRRIADDSHLLTAIRYVARNPVEAGVVDRPQDWVWSTYGQLIGERAAWSCFSPAFVLAHFSPRPDTALRIVREFVEGARHPRGV